MKKIIIAGATGMVGTHLVAELLGRQADAGGETYTPTAVAHSEESWRKLDWLLLRRGLGERPHRRTVAALEYIDDCRRLMRDERPDIVFNCAARVAVGRARDGEKLVTRNVEITHNLVTAALELPPEERPLFVHVSSVAALGGTAGPSGCIDENAVMDNLVGASAYARSKFLSENEVWRGAAHGRQSRGHPRSDVPRVGILAERVVQSRAPGGRPFLDRRPDCVRFGRRRGAGHGSAGRNARSLG